MLNYDFVFTEFIIHDLELTSNLRYDKHISLSGALDRCRSTKFRVQDAAFN
jgi:hypothetical protein